MTTYIAECPEGHQDTVRVPCERLSHKSARTSSTRTPWYCCWSEGKSIAPFCRFLTPTIKPPLGRYMIKRSDCAACKALSQQREVKKEISRQTADKARRATAAHMWSDPPHSTRPLRRRGSENERPFEWEHRGSGGRPSSRIFGTDEEERLRLGKWSEKNQPYVYCVDASIAFDSQVFESNPLIPVLYQDKYFKFGHCNPPPLLIQDYQDISLVELAPSYRSHHYSDCDHPYNAFSTPPPTDINEPYVHLGLDEARWTQIQEGAGHGTVPPPPYKPLPSLPQSIQTHVAPWRPTDQILVNKAQKTKFSLQSDRVSESQQTSLSRQISSKSLVPVWSTTTSPTSALTSPPKRTVSTVASMFSLRSRLGRNFTLETRIEMDHFIKFWSL